MAKEKTCIHRHLDNRVLCLEFEQPERKNAITQGMYTALADALLEADAAPDVRAILLEGSAEVFTSGNDIGDFARSAGCRIRACLGALHAGRGSGAQAFDWRSERTRGCHRRYRVAACDLVYAGSNATLLFPFVKLGLCPEFGSKPTAGTPPRLATGCASSAAGLGDRSAGAGRIDQSCAGRCSQASCSFPRGRDDYAQTEAPVLYARNHSAYRSRKRAFQPPTRDIAGPGGIRRLPEQGTRLRRDANTF